MSNKIRFTKELFVLNEPLVVFGKDKKDRDYLCTAVYDEKYTNPYLCVRVSEDQYNDILMGKVDLKTIVCFPSYKAWYITDMLSEQSNLVKIASELWELDEDYIPDSGFIIELGEIEAEAEMSANKVYIDGRWNPTDLSTLNRSYNRIYSFLYSIIKTNGETIINECTMPFRDGFSSMHLFNKLEQKIPQGFKPDIKSMQYASPGFIEFFGHSDVNESFLNILKLMKNKRTDIYKCYRELYKYLQDENLIGVDVLTFNDESTHTSYLLRKYNYLLKLLEIDSFVDSNFDSLNALQKSKLILSLFRRLDELTPLLYSEKITIK